MESKKRRNIPGRKKNTRLREKLLEPIILCGQSDKKSVTLPQGASFQANSVGGGERIGNEEFIFYERYRPKTKKMKQEIRKQKNEKHMN